jgi:predicted nucleic acid-binding protein
MTGYPETIVLDCEGVSRAVRGDPGALSWLTAARRENHEVVASAATLVEAIDPQKSRAKAKWAVSQMVVRPVTQETAETATDLLRAAHRHGHSDALDALVAATAVESGGLVTVLTSDPGDLKALLADHPGILVEAI